MLGISYIVIHINIISIMGPMGPGGAARTTRATAKPLPWYIYMFVEFGRPWVQTCHLPCGSYSALVVNRCLRHIYVFNLALCDILAQGIVMP